MKRIFTALFILVILIGTLPASAAPNPELTGSHETAAPGETVTIALNLNENPGLAAWKIELTWDPSALTLDPESVTLNSEFSNGLFVENSQEDGKLYLVWANAENVNATGDLITLDFVVASKAASGSYPITVTTSGTKTQDGKSVDISSENATITLPSQQNTQPTQPNTPPTQGSDDRQDTPTTPSIDPPTYESSLPFVDVKKDAYYYTPTAWAVQNGITNGSSPTTFSPDALCNRAQVVTFLWRAAGSPEPIQLKSPFTDVPLDAYYYKAVLWAVEQGITSGTSTTTFSPDVVASRAQTVTFLWRSCGSPISLATTFFSDVTAGTYYEAAVRWAVANNITIGTSSLTFSPDLLCSRGQIVTFLYRTFSN